MEAPIHFLIFGGLLQPALRFDAYFFVKEPVLKDVDSGKKSGKSKSVAKSPSDLDLSGLLRLLSQRYGKKASLEKVKNTLDKLPIKKKIS